MDEWLVAAEITPEGAIHIDAWRVFLDSQGLLNRGKPLETPENGWYSLDYK